MMYTTYYLVCSVVDIYIYIYIYIAYRSVHYVVYTTIYIVVYIRNGMMYTTNYLVYTTICNIFTLLYIRIVSYVVCTIVRFMNKK